MTIEFDEERWEKVKQTHRAWWNGELERPLYHAVLTGAPSDREPSTERYHDYAAFYDLATPVEKIVDAWDYNLSTQRWLGDAFPNIWLNFGPGVIAAFLGAKLESHIEGNTVWFHPREHLNIGDIHFEYDAENVWLKRIRSLAAAAHERWNGMVQVGMTDLGGNLDILSIFRPGERLLLDFCQNPEEVKRLTWELHELWMCYFEKINDMLQPLNPGYSCWTPLFCEEPWYMLQCDLCYMISPAMFDEFAKPELAKSCDRFPRSLYHLDGKGQLAHLDSLLAIKSLGGVQWVYGTGQPDGGHWSDVYRKILDAGKNLQLLGETNGRNEPEDVLADRREQWGRVFRVIYGDWNADAKQFEALLKHYRVV